MPMATSEEQREYQRRWIAKRRQEWIDANGPCAWCGSEENLEVDHADRTTKKIPVRALWSMSPANPRRIAELAKCQVLCHPCHVDKTWSEDFERAQHGSTSRYSKHGCRCSSCCAAKAEAVARRKSSPQRDSNTRPTE